MNILKRFMNNNSSPNLSHAAALIKQSDCTVALTGAGISVASGIPDFRSPNGLWTVFDPLEYATLPAFLQQPEKVWRMFQAVHNTLRGCQPNPAHLALAQLEAAQKLQAVITQNIDGLHQLAGSQNVIELHGNTQSLACPGCDYYQPLDPTQFPPDPVPCPQLTVLPQDHQQAQYLKPAVILFGEDLQPTVMRQFWYWQNKIEVLLVIGTSADVYPAASLPRIVKDLGGKIIEINVQPTAISTIADYVLTGKAEMLLPQLLEKIG
jgi:NAD-dependent deacetylase